MGGALVDSAVFLIDPINKVIWAKLISGKKIVLVPGMIYESGAILRSVSLAEQIKKQVYPHGIDTSQQTSIAGWWVVAITGADNPVICPVSSAIDLPHLDPVS